MSYSKSHITLLILFFTSILLGQIPQNEIKAKIEVEKIEGSVKITGTAENLTEVIKSVSYRMAVIKNNPISNNESNNTQEGIITLEPNEVKKISTTQVNLSEHDQAIVMLLFYNENKDIVAKDRIILGDEKKKMQ